MTTYIGMDAHSKTSVLVAVNSRGRELAAQRVKTCEGEILGFVRRFGGSTALAVEESHITQWVYRLLKDEVTKFIAFNAAHIHRKRGAADDFIDARNIAHQLRGNFLENVFHEDSELAELRTIISAYRDVVRDVVRAKNRYKAIFRANALATDEAGFYSKKERINDLVKASDRFVLESLQMQLEHIEKLRSRYVEALEASAAKIPVIGLLSTIPGIATIRAAIIASAICSAERFASKHELWAYSMLVRHKQESDGVKYASIKVQARADLKEVFVGAAETVLAGESALRRYYDEQIARGKDHKAAKRNLARKIAAISLAVMRKQAPYRDGTSDERTAKRRKKSRKSRH